ncbi:MAG: hypothetical protein JXA92_01100 [candidate division Zixibacteria bacterium]|nr:hypothetical protein [candidate division Zixibacteria bacterium]
MRNILNALAALIFIFNLNCGNTKDDFANEVAFEKIIETAPLATRLLFNNNYVTVIEFDLKPGAKLPAFRLGDFTLYALSDCEIGYLDDNRVATKKLKSRDIFWNPEGRQMMENRGTDTARFFIVARKATALPEYVLEDLDRDVSQTNPEVTELLLDNDNIRVIEVNLQPGEEIRTHRGIARIIYSLNPYTINYTSDEYENRDSTVRKTFEPGYTHWHESGSHSLVNIGETPLRELIFEFKK